MRVKIMRFLIGITLVISPGVAAAQWGFQPGDYEVTLEGSGASEDNGDNGAFNVDGSLGYFFSKTMEVGLRQGVGYSDEGVHDDAWSASTRGFLDYHFDMMKLQPFVGVNFGYLYGEDVNDSFFAGVEGGFKAFVNETTFVYGLLEYNYTFDDADNPNDRYDDGRLVYALGLGLRF